MNYTAGVLLTALASGTVLGLCATLYVDTVVAQAAAAPPIHPSALVPSVSAVVPPHPPAAEVQDGDFLVGKDVEAGLIGTIGPRNGGTDCFWSRNAMVAGQAGPILVTGDAVTPTFITLRSGEIFRTLGGCTWTHY